MYAWATVTSAAAAEVFQMEGWSDQHCQVVVGPEGRERIAESEHFEQADRTAGTHWMQAALGAQWVQQGPLMKMKMMLRQLMEAMLQGSAQTEGEVQGRMAFHQTAT